MVAISGPALVSADDRRLDDAHGAITLVDLGEM